MSADLGKLEPEAVRALQELGNTYYAEDGTARNMIAYSTALSLKRIADELRRSNDREDKLAVARMQQMGGGARG